MIYLLSGDNTFEIERAVKELTSKFDGDVERVDGSELTTEQLPNLFMGVTLFAAERLIVIKNASVNKTIWNQLSDWLEKATATEVVFVEYTPDKRTKTYKWLQKNARVTEKKPLQFYEAVQWVMAAAKDLNLSRQDSEYLVDYVGLDQWRLSSELDKLRLSGEPVNKELIQRVVEPTPQATSFELLDAAFSANKEAFERLFATVSQQEDPYMFFGLLASQIIAIAGVKADSEKRPEQRATELGIHPFVIRKVTPLAKAVSLQAMKELVALLAELDANMKSRSVEPWTQIRSFLSALTITLQSK